MDRLLRQITLGYAYHVSENLKSSSVDQLFWALDRFDYDRNDLDEGSCEQRGHATQAIAHELDERRIPLRNPMIPVEFPRDFPGTRPLIHI